LDYKTAQINVREVNLNIRVLATGSTFTAHLTILEGIRVTTRTLFRSTLYNPAMNKRARKRLKETIEKKNLERQKILKEQSSASSQTKERRGFTVKPEKKRG
jgi:hypothetical protein